MSMFSMSGMPGSPAEALRVSLTSKKYCRLTSRSRLRSDARAERSSERSAPATSLNMPAAMELIRRSTWSGRTVPMSSKNCIRIREDSSSVISMPTSRLIESRTSSRSVSDMAESDRTVIASYPKRYPPVMSAAMFSPRGSGYGMASSRSRPRRPAEMATVLAPVSRSTWPPFSSPLASTHSLGSVTSMLFPIFCSFLTNLAN